MLYVIGYCTFVQPLIYIQHYNSPFRILSSALSCIIPQTRALPLMIYFTIQGPIKIKKEYAYICLINSEKQANSKVRQKVQQMVDVGQSWKYSLKSSKYCNICKSFQAFMIISCKAHIVYGSSRMQVLCSGHANLTTLHRHILSSRLNGSQREGPVWFYIQY